MAMAMVPTTTLLALVVAPARALAHPGVPPAPHDLWRAWSAEPVTLALLALGTWAYARGVRALWRRAGRGRGVARWRSVSGAAGLVALAVALVSPVDAMGGALFAAHMTQHLLLVAIAAPLLVLGDVATATLWALPLRARRAVGRAWRDAHRLRRAWRALLHPAAAWTLHVAAMWAWHAPTAYEGALRSPLVHALEHASFFATALLFWWVLLAPRRRPLAFGATTLYLFGAALQGTVFGALVTLAPRPWYPAYAATTMPWGLTPLEDQQLAGLLMWIPAGLVYLAALVPPLVAALRERPVGEMRYEPG
jgi:putative membrane protein